MGHDVFISYSSKDKKVADAACAVLEGRGLRCWMAPRDIRPGSEWGESIIEGIEGARTFVLIFSGNANGSPQVRREVERSVSRGLPVIPFRIEDVLPAKSLEYFISSSHWLDALTPPLERHLDYLADVVDWLLSPPSTAPATAHRPTVPPEVQPSRRWPFWIAPILVIGALAAGTGYWLSGNRAVETLESNAGDANLILPAPKAAEPAPAPASQDEELLDFASVPNSVNDNPEADGFLRNARISVRIVGRDPPGTGLTFYRSDAIGHAVAGPTRNLLAFRRGPPPSPDAIVNRLSVVLEFEEPVARVRFLLPSFVAPDVSAVLSATALGGSGEVIDRGSIGPEGPLGSASARMITLSAWQGEGIRRVRLEGIEAPEPSSGEPPRPIIYWVIEGITIRRITAPR